MSTSYGGDTGCLVSNESLHCNAGDLIAIGDSAVGSAMYPIHMDLSRSGS